MSNIINFQEYKDKRDKKNAEKDIISAIKAYLEDELSLEELESFYPNNK